MPSFAKLRRLGRRRTGEPSQNQDSNVSGLAVEKNSPGVLKPIKLFRRNKRRPLHFTFDLGTPATRIGVRPVSYSAETWILSNSALFCQTNVCNHGIFGQQQSSTYTAAAPPQANASIPAIGLHYGGHGFQDTVRLAGVTVENMTMKLALDSTRDASLLGLDCRASMSYPQEEAGFLEELADRALISTAAYSVWLGGSDDAECGNVLFGAVDHSKYSGDNLWTLRTHDVVASPWGGRYIALSGLNASSPTGSDALMPNGTVVPVQVIFGKWTNVLPFHLAQQMWHAAGATYSRDARATLIPCQQNASAGHFDFQLGGSRGPVVRIGMAQLVVPTSMYGEGSASWIDDSGLCEFNLANSSEPADWRLGDDFLGSMYVLFDPQRNKVAVAPLVRETEVGAEQIEALAPPDGHVSYARPVPGQPSALTAPSLPSAPGPTSLLSAEGFQRSLAGGPDSGDAGSGADAGLSTAAKAAIGLAVSLGALLALALFLWRRAARRLQKAQAVIEALRSSPQRASTYELQDRNSLHPIYELGENKPRRRSELPS